MATEVGKRVGQRLRELRLAAGLSQAQLAERLGADVAVETVSRFERGAKVPSLAWIDRIAQVLGTTLEGLFSGIPSTPPERSADADLRRITDLLTPLPTAQVRHAFRVLRACVDGVEAAIGKAP